MINSLSGAGKALIVFGIILVIVGILLTQWDKFPWLSKIPGNFQWRKGNFTFYFPLGLSILVSLLLSLIFYLISKFKS